MDNCKDWLPTSVGRINQKLVFDMCLAICMPDGKGSHVFLSRKFYFSLLLDFDLVQAAIESYAMQLAQYTRYLTAVGMSSQ